MLYFSGLDHLVVAEAVVGIARPRVCVDPCSPSIFTPLCGSLVAGR